MESSSAFDSGTPAGAVPGYAVVMRGGVPTVYTGLHSVAYWRAPLAALVAGGTVDPAGNLLSEGAPPAKYGKDILNESAFATLIDCPQQAAWRARHVSPADSAEKLRQHQLMVYRHEYRHEYRRDLAKGALSQYSSSRDQSGDTICLLEDSSSHEWRGYRQIPPRAQVALGMALSLMTTLGGLAGYYITEAPTAPRADTTAFGKLIMQYPEGYGTYTQLLAMLDAWFEYA